MLHLKLWKMGPDPDDVIHPHLLRIFLVIWSLYLKMPIFPRVFMITLIKAFSNKKDFVRKLITDYN